MGVGKIARDQHIPAIAARDDFELAATVSGSGGVDGIENHDTLADLLDARPDISAIAMTMPPMPRFDAARRAIAAGRHVMLEKPPGATTSEVRQLIDMARAAGVTLHGTWHSRHADAVASVRQWLATRTITGGHILWKENVREWHPGQQWIWQPGGMGVFDTGINALSILTEILPVDLRVRTSVLSFPANRDAPIAADLVFAGPDGVTITADMDWRYADTARWEQTIKTEDGTVKLLEGGARWTLDGVKQKAEGPGEYPGVYARFAELLSRGESDVDDRPLRHVADAFLLAKHISVDPFHDDA
nr:Gfo/Idh/MocA family oxidoreductase [Palleronia pontilimi]